VASTPRPRPWLRWVVGAIVVVIVLVVGGPFVYIHFIEKKAPPKLSVQSVPTSTLAPGQHQAALAGTWKVGGGSTVGYRVKETLFGQSHTAAGRTSSVTGTMTIAGTNLTAASFRVDMTTVKSDQSIRDDQFQGRIMDTADFPTSTFSLTQPITLAPVPADGAVGSYRATGKLTLHGTTRTVTIPLTTKRTGNEIAVSGSLPIRFSDYDIGNPSGGPASVGNSGTMEFALALTPSA